jgi:hypothetical protein
MRTQPGKRDLVVSAGIIAISALILLAMGRVPICKCGIVRVWSGDIFGSENSQQITDPYTFTHLIHGALLYGMIWVVVGNSMRLGSRLVWAIALESIWEILENTNYVIDRYREATISLDYYGDSVVNSVSDILAMAFGFWLVSRLPIRASIALMLAIDLALLIVFRDSLAINIIMLIHPVDAIRQWQGP